MPYKNPADAAAFRARPEQREKDRQRTRQWLENNKERDAQTRRDRAEERSKQLTEHIGDCCAKCGSTDRLELDHINPGLKYESVSDGTARHLKYHRTKKHLTEQLELNNLRWLCYACHRDHSRAQRVAAWQHFINLPLEKQNELIMEYKP